MSEANGVRQCSEGLNIESLRVYSGDTGSALILFSWIRAHDAGARTIMHTEYVDVKPKNVN